MSRHAIRVQNFRAFLTSMGAPMTRANLLRLAQKSDKSAHRINKRRSALAYDQRLAAIEQARAYYTLARAAEV